MNMYLHGTAVFGMDKRVPVIPVRNESVVGSEDLATTADSFVRVFVVGLLGIVAVGLYQMVSKVS